ncbi:MAG TPA: hypothetical protein VMH81_11275 [Bryobacteraceae bacterium]|nr:hypothetical protein [Bryobacteraceae bacterium]
MPTRTVRAFLVYAEEDYRFKDLLINQARSAKLAVEFTDMPNKQPWVPRWKTACRSRMFDSDGAIVFISTKTKQGAGVQFELECLDEIRIPVLGVYVDKCERSATPEELQGSQLIDWNWALISGFLQSLGARKAGAP